MIYPTIKDIRVYIVHDIFYNQGEDKVKDSIGSFFTDLFNMKKTFTKSDLDMILTIYKILDKNLKK